MSESLEVLLQKCKTGENKAINALVQRFQPWAIGLATALINDKHLAEDAVQDAFLIAIKRLPDLRNPEAFPGWFRQIVRTCANRIIRNQKEVPLNDEERIPEDNHSPEDRLREKELRQKVHQALRNLPAKERNATELFYLDDLSCLQVADLLQIPVGTVKRRLYDARKRMRGMLLGYVEDKPAR